MYKNPAGERNKDPILGVLKRFIDINSKFSLLEVSSGPGLHASYFASHFPNLTIQPTEYERDMFESIKGYRNFYKVQNVEDPIYLDISKSESADIFDAEFDFMLNINMIHISPFCCTKGLFKNGRKLLKSGGILFTYGPYAKDGVLEPESNISFDQSLRSRNSSWGIRDIRDLKIEAEKNSFELLEINDLPSNNKCLIWKKNC